MVSREVLRRLMTVSPLLAVFTACGCAAPGVEKADMVLRNGTIITLDESLPEAGALAIRGDRIVAVGSSEEIGAYVGDRTEVIDLMGRTAVPGFIEGHGHFLGVGDARLQLRLMETNSWDEIVAMVADAVSRARPGELIRGRGWHQSKWTSPPEPDVEGFPLHHVLSAVSPDNPVILRHASGHATFANAKAMEMSGVGRDTADPPGGEILRDTGGNPTGLFRERASELLEAATRHATPPDPRRQAELAAQESLAKGITSFQDAGSSFETVDVLKSMVDRGELGLRLWVMLREPLHRLAELGPSYRMIGYGDNHLTVRAVKRSIDGALGSRGAWLLEPYADLPDGTGLNTDPVADVEATAAWAIDNDFQMCVHAIGDRANRETLDIFAKTFAAHPDKTGLRWRDEHAQHLHPDDIPRFAELGVIASMQGIHCTSDAPYVIARLGERRAAEGAYVWKSLLDSGAVVSNGTDAPVEDVSPIASFYATVSRRAKDGAVFFPRQRLSRMEALRTYTINAAYAAFEEEIKGSLSAGKLADITVLSQNILAVAEQDLPSTEVTHTIVGGRLMYNRDDRAARR